ncbi:hypothetical protein K9M16_00855 [Candidatus Babeliales bacterium]|nr:hypothetical protein [Candidatus Babeliales bacterium]
MDFFKKLTIFLLFLSANQFCLAGSGCVKAWNEPIEYYSPEQRQKIRELDIISKNYTYLSFSLEMGFWHHFDDKFLEYVLPKSKLFLGQFFYLEYGGLMAAGPFSAKYIKKIELSRCFHITDRIFGIISEYFKNLEIIGLIDCPNITSSGILNLLLRCKRLVKIYVSQDFFIDGELSNYITRLNKPDLIEKIDFDFYKRLFLQEGLDFSVLVK